MTKSRAELRNENFICPRNVKSNPAASHDIGNNIEDATAIIEATIRKLQTMNKNLKRYNVVDLRAQFGTADACLELARELRAALDVINQ